MSKFYVKLWMPATEMFVLFQGYETWDDTISAYNWLKGSGLIAIVGRNSGLFEEDLA